MLAGQTVVVGAGTPFVSRRHRFFSLWGERGSSYYHHTGGPSGGFEVGFRNERDGWRLLQQRHNLPVPYTHVWCIFHGGMRRGNLEEDISCRTKKLIGWFSMFLRYTSRVSKTFLKLYCCLQLLLYTYCIITSCFASTSNTIFPADDSDNSSLLVCQPRVSRQSHIASSLKGFVDISHLYG